MRPIVRFCYLCETLPVTPLPSAFMSTVVLSSGFLAFARHIGVARAFRATGRRATRLSGVSSGSLIGALWAAGATPEEMTTLVSEMPPIRSLRPRLFFGRGGPGLLSLDPFVARIAARLPARIEDLPLPFSVGVVRRSDGACVLLERGPLAEAIAASCAMPWIFGPRVIEGASCVDGGAKDRIFLRPLLELHPADDTVVHVVDASQAGRQKRSGVVDAQLDWAANRTALTVVRTPRSGASFFSLGDIPAQIAEAEARATTALSCRPGPG